MTSSILSLRPPKNYKLLWEKGMFRDEYIVHISEYLLARFFKDYLILNIAPKLQLFPSLQYHTPTHPFPISMNILFSLSFNPLSLKKSTHLFRNFVFLFSLLGLWSFAWGERFETLFVQTQNTPHMAEAEMRNYLMSDACLSTKSLQLAQGEIAYVFAVGSSIRPNANFENGYAYDTYPARLANAIIDNNGLDSNITLGNNYFGWGNEGVSNLPISSTDPIIGPASIKIRLKPQSATNSTSRGWNYGNKRYDFKASEGFVTFRIVGAEQAPSKKFATVIPENASGNVRIVLEQSTDLINWSSANPGVFSPSTSKRFFRVRSVEE